MGALEVGAAVGTVVGLIMAEVLNQSPISAPQQAAPTGLATTMQGCARATGSQLIAREKMETAIDAEKW